MATVLYPWQILVTAMAGWITRQQDAVIDYLREENRVLKEQLGGRRFPLTDDQRRRLAAKGKVLSRKLLDKIATIVTPDTILRWHHRLVSMKWDYSWRRKPGRPPLALTIRRLVVQFALENSSMVEPVPPTVRFSSVPLSFLK